MRCIKIGKNRYKSNTSKYCLAGNKEKSQLEATKSMIKKSSRFLIGVYLETIKLIKIVWRDINKKL